MNALSEPLGIPENPSTHLHVLKQTGIIDVRVDAQRRESLMVAVLRNLLGRDGTPLDFGGYNFRVDPLPS